MKGLYFPLIVSSLLFSYTSSAAENNRSVGYIYASTLNENLGASLFSSKMDTLIFSEGMYDEKAELINTLADLNPVKNAFWTQLKMAHPEKKILLSFGANTNDSFKKLTDAAFREKLAENLVKLLATPFSVYKKPEGCQTNCSYKEVGKVYPDGIDFRFWYATGFPQPLDEKQNDSVLKLFQLVREKLGPDSKKLLSLSAAAEGADPVECKDNTVFENCSYTGNRRAYYHGQLLPLLTKGKNVFDFFNVNDSRAGDDYQYKVALANYVHAVGDSTKIVLGLTVPSDNEGYLNSRYEYMVRAEWQASNNYGGFSFRSLTGGTIAGRSFAPLLEYFNDLKNAADSAKPAVDTKPPAAPADLQASADVKDHSINLTWQPAEDNAGAVSYRIYRNGVNIDSAKVPHWKDTHVQPGIKYEYYLLAVDEAGNVSPASNHISAEVPVGQNLEKPLAPSGLSVSASTQTTLDIQWQPVTNVAVSQYIVYRDGHKVQSLGSLSFHDSGLTANTAYTYSIMAQSVKGDLSELSMPLRAVTLADPVTQPPPIAAWETDVTYQAGDVVTYNGNQYQCLQKHDSMQEWNPEAAQSLWKRMK